MNPLVVYCSVLVYIFFTCLSTYEKDSTLSCELKLKIIINFFSYLNKKPNENPASVLK